MKIGETADVKLINTADESEVYDYHFEVMESGAFEYGNRTCTVITCPSHEIPQSFDTRYFHGDLSDFLCWWYDNNINKDYRLEVVA